MLAGRAATILAALAVTGCGGSAVPEGSPHSVRIEIFQNPLYGAPNVSTTPVQPYAVYKQNREWERVSSRLPDELPEPVDQGDDCRAGQIVSVRMSSGAEVDYGPCRWPQEIEPVRALMRTLLQRERARQQ